jgi:short-subunit dehydrogenase
MSQDRKMSHWKHALILGASSGMGAAIARQLAVDGCSVALVARREDRLEAVACDIRAAGGKAIVAAHDVGNLSQVPALFEKICRELGGLDLVVYACGVLEPVAIDEYDTDKDLQTLTVNLLGAVAWLNPAAERFGRIGSGTIIGIGSVAGDRGRVGSPIYNTSKAGLETYLEALRNRLHRQGVRVVTIKPGFIDTEMTQGMPGLFWLISASEAARRILRIARRGSVTAYVPARWRLVMLIIRSIPSFIFRRLSV